jgi:RimJ/RimL family protein N-acetyltransferase
MSEPDGVAREHAIEVVRLPDVEISALTALVNDPRVTRHMPLASPMTEDDVGAWVRAKEAIWDERGFGPWAILVDGELAGWGGLQPYDDEPDGELEIAVVLAPTYWGLGRSVFRRFAADAFERLGVDHVIIAIPPSRRRVAGIERLGARRVGETSLAGADFVLWRLDRPP